MDNNYTLRRLRYALDIDDPTMINIFKLSEYEMTPSHLTNLLKPEDTEGYVECSNQIMEYFLDGLISHKRGKKDGPVKKSDSPLTNNTILKKLRIALELKEDDMLSIFKLASIDVSKPELTALFRREGHKHYKECGDQFFRHFLTGLTIRYRTD
jgi:uncharacterized protein YehS (DUF1456 family)